MESEFRWYRFQHTLFYSWAAPPLVCFSLQVCIPHPGAARFILSSVFYMMNFFSVIMDAKETASTFFCNASEAPSFPGPLGEEAIPMRIEEGSMRVVCLSVNPGEKGIRS
jgi:hypothetical protein